MLRMRGPCMAKILRSLGLCQDLTLESLPDDMWMVQDTGSLRIFQEVQPALCWEQVVPWLPKPCSRKTRPECVRAGTEALLRAFLVKPTYKALNFKKHTPTSPPKPQDLVPAERISKLEWLSVSTRCDLHVSAVHTKPYELEAAEVYSV